jgi:hypothetical protein
MTHYQLTLLVITTLCLGASTLRCYNCNQSSYKVGNKTFDVPGGVKCDRNSTFACTDNEVACSTITIGYKIEIQEGGSGSAEGTLKGCSNSTNQANSLCEAAEEAYKQSLESVNVSLSNFKCSAHFCMGRDLCNAGNVPGTSLFVAALCLLMGQFF